MRTHLIRACQRINLYANPANVKLLLHCDGSNESTIFTDSSLSPKTVTAQGSAQLSTTLPKYGSAAGLFNGTTSALIVPDSDDFNITSGVFTIAMWVRPAVNVTTRMNLLSHFDGTDKGYGLAVMNTGQIRAFAEDPSGAAQIIGPAGSALLANTYYHIAFTGDGSTYRLFLDGTIVTSAAITRLPGNSSLSLEIGAEWGVGTRWFNGMIDDILYMAGECLYSAAFTPPVNAYPNP